MTFVIQQSTTALHIFPAPHGTGITTRRRQGEVLVSDGMRTKPFYFDKVTYAPFQEALYSAVGNAALTQRGLVHEVHTSTWVAGRPTEDVVIDVCKVFTTNTVRALFTKAPTSQDASLALSLHPAVECAVRCVYPWGVLDLVRNEELPGDEGADWANCGRSPVHDVASFSVVLHAALRFLRESKGNKKQCPLLQLCLFSKLPVGCGRALPYSSFALTVSPPVAEVSRAFAVDGGVVHDALLQLRKGRWMDCPLFRFLVPPSVSVLDAFTLISCVGGSEEVLRGTKGTGGNTATLAACGFGSRDSAASTHIAGKDETSLSTSMPSPLTIHKADRSLTTATNTPNGYARGQRGESGRTPSPANLFDTPNRRGGAIAAIDLSDDVPTNAPPTQPAEALPSMWQQTPLTYFGSFGTSATKGSRAVSPTRCSGKTSPADPRSGSRHSVVGASDLLPDAARSVESELSERVREKELRADEAVRAAEERMAQARRTEMAAREVTRAADADMALARARYDDEMNVLRSEQERLRKRKEEMSAELDALTTRVFESREEATSAELKLQAVTQELERQRKAAEEVRRDASDSAYRVSQMSTTCATLAAGFADYTRITSTLFGDYAVTHQETFQSAAETILEGTLHRIQSHHRALEDVSRRLGEATAQLVDTQDKVDRSLSDMERSAQHSHEEVNRSAAEVRHLRQTEEQLRDTNKALQDQLDTLRWQVGEAEATAASQRTAAQQASGTSTHQGERKLLEQEEAIARQTVHTTQEEARWRLVTALTSALHHTATVECLLSAESQKRAEVSAESEMAYAALLRHWVPLAPQTSLTSSVSDGTATGPLRAEIAALEHTKERLQDETEAALRDMHELSELKDTLEKDIASLLGDLVAAANEVTDAETAMLRDSERSLKILQISAAESASQYSALLDRCTALIEARSASRRNSMASSNYGD